MPRVLAAVGVVAALAYLWLISPAAPTLGDARFVVHVVVKPLPVLCLAAWTAGWGAGRYARWMTAGLLFAALGDALLLVEGDAGFVAGLGAFLVAHVIYAIGFTADVRAPKPLRLLPFAAWVVGALVALWAGLGPMKAPVTAYCAAIAIMMWRAWARVGAPGVARRGALAAAVGAMVFAASDTLIAFDRFGAPIAHVGYVIMVTYWIGQAGIASSVSRRMTEEKVA